MNALRQYRKLIILCPLLCFWLGFGATLANAADAASLEQRVAKLESASEHGAPAINSGDNAWLLASSALVLMMTAPGLILFYGGLVRTQERALHDDAQPDPDGGDVGALDGFRLQHGLWQGQRVLSAIRSQHFLLQRRRRRAQSGLRAARCRSRASCCFK